MKRQGMLSRCIATVAAVFAGASALAAADVQVIAQGLNNPRGIALAPNGWLYVAETGTGGDGGCQPNPEPGQPPRCYGESGALTRIDPDGIAPMRRVVTGLPSMAVPGGFAATGPVDVDFFGMNAYVVMGWGGDPALRASAGPKGKLFGQVLWALPNGRYYPAGDISAHEARENPDGTHVDSNPYGILAQPGRRLVADAGGNSIVSSGLLDWIFTGHPTRTFAVLPRTAADLDAVATTVRDVALGAGIDTKRTEDGPVARSRRDGRAVRAAAQLVGKAERIGQRARPHEDLGVRDDAQEAAQHQVAVTEAFRAVDQRLQPVAAAGVMRRVFPVRVHQHVDVGEQHVRNP